MRRNRYVTRAAKIAGRFQSMKDELIACCQGIGDQQKEIVAQTEALICENDALSGEKAAATKLIAGLTRLMQGD